MLLPCMHMSMHLATRPTPCMTGQVHMLVLDIRQVSDKNLGQYTAYYSKPIYVRLYFFVENYTYLFC